MKRVQEKPRLEKTMEHTFTLGTQEAEEGGSESEDSLLYRMRSRTTRSIQRNPVSKGEKKKITQW